MKKNILTLTLMLLIMNFAFIVVVFKSEQKKLKKEIDSLKTELKNCEDVVHYYEKENDSLFWNK